MESRLPADLCERSTHGAMVGDEGSKGDSFAPTNEGDSLARALLATGDQWTLLIVSALAVEPLRLSELRTYLPGISAGVLDRHLQQMVTRRLIVRERYRELPPRVEYRLDLAGGELVPVATQLAHWGVRHMQGEAHLRARIDIPDAGRA